MSDKSKNAKKYNFGFKLNDNLFKSTEPENISPYEIKNILISKLLPFANHPFKLYEGKRFDDMRESIKENGVMLPIIARPADGGNYEILSGHNRTEAAKAAGLEFVPAIIREDLNEAEAMLIVTETNLIQRSFADLSHVEKSIALAMHYEAVKRQGSRAELINEIEYLLKNNGNISNNAHFEAGAQLGHQLKSRDITALKYGLSKNTVARYLRVNKLIDPLKERLDNKEFGIVPAVEISYLSSEEQEKLNILLGNQTYKLDIKKASQLREFSEQKKLGADDAEDILSGLVNQKSGGKINVKLKQKNLARYFKPEQKSEEIEAEIFQALEFYRANKS